MTPSGSQLADSGHGSEDSVDASNQNNHQQKVEASDAGSEDAEKAVKPAPNAWMNPESFPEGGTKAWLTVAGASACLFVSFGWVNCVGVFQDYYQTHQLKTYSPSNIAWIPALQSRSSLPIFIPFSDHTSILHAVWGDLCWQDIRYLWAPVPYTYWHLFPCLRLDDDEYLDKILSNPS